MVCQTINGIISRGIQFARLMFVECQLDSSKKSMAFLRELSGGEHTDRIGLALTEYVR